MNDQDNSASQTQEVDFTKALEQGWLPIREVARQTGVNAVTLRSTCPGPKTRYRLTAN